MPIHENDDPPDNVARARLDVLERVNERMHQENIARMDRIQRQLDVNSGRLWLALGSAFMAAATSTSILLIYLITGKF